MGTHRSILRNHRASYKYLLRASLPLLFDVFLLFASNPLLLLLFLSYLFFPPCFCVCLRAASQKGFKWKMERHQGPWEEGQRPQREGWGPWKEGWGPQEGRGSSAASLLLSSRTMANAECPCETDVVGDPNYSPLWGRGKWSLLLLSSDPHLSNLQEIGLPVIPSPCQSWRNPGKQLRN